MRAISTSAPARSRSAGTRNNRSRRVGRILSTIEAPPSNGSYRLSPSSSCMPSELVAFACGSRSTIKMRWPRSASAHPRSEEHTSELQSPCNLVCRLLLEKKKKKKKKYHIKKKKKKKKTKIKQKQKI